MNRLDKFRRDLDGGPLRAVESSLQFRERLIIALGLVAFGDGIESLLRPASRENLLRHVTFHVFYE